MKYNYRRLIGRIIEKCGSQQNFSKKMQCSERSISQKLNSKVGFKQSEIIKACELLSIPKREIPEYFFNIEVQTIEQKPA